MQETQNNQLFTDLSAEESATINGGRRYYRRPYHGYRRRYPGYVSSRRRRYPRCY
jgi:hypothetical protein